MPQIDLNEQFQKTLELLENTNKNVFLTGKAGTGKSTLLNFFRSTTSKKIVVLAPTGVAAVNIEGETIHSFFKFKPNVTLNEANKIATRYQDSQLYLELNTVVIDEISMVRADLLDCIDTFLKVVRKNFAPFGGVQMIFIGDLYQLPPVLQREDEEALLSVYGSPYFFDSFVMVEAMNNPDYAFKFIELQKIYRQRDQTFIDILNAIRNKKISRQDIEVFNRNTVKTSFNLDDDHIFLTTTNAKAESINQDNIENLPGEMFTFWGDVEGEFTDKHLITDEELNLKKNAKVMFVNNDPMGRWVNGTIGYVEDLNEERVKVTIQNGDTVWVEPARWSLFSTYFDNTTKSIERKEVGSFTQIPLKLAWAITIHKSQGKTFDKVIIDLGYRAFAHGQVYVALSRCRFLEGIVMARPLRDSDIIVSSDIERFMNGWK